MNIRRYLVVTILISILTVPYFATVDAVNVSLIGSSSLGRAYLSPVLLEDNYWLYGAYVEDESLLSITPPSEGFELVSQAKVGNVLIVMDKEAPVGVLRGRVSGLLGIFPTHLYKIVYAVVTRDKLVDLVYTPGVLAVLPDTRVDSLINKEMKWLESILEHEQQLLEEIAQAVGFDYHYTVNITRARDVWTEFNIKGEDVTIAIIDTGVDYGSPGLGLSAIARDEFGLPMIFDASSLGLVLTPVEAVVDSDGYITINETQLYVFQPPYYVWKWTNQLYVRLTGCRSYTAWVPFPAGNKWYVGEIAPPGSTVKFGLAFQDISFTVAGTSSRLQITVPILLVDTDGDGAYDTLYADTTTALNLTRMALAPAPCSVVIPGTLGTVRDFSFADEVPVRYGSEVIARDLDGDGLNDVSFGTLAGYVYDAAFAIILEKIGIWKELVTPLPPLYGYQTTNILDMRDVWRYEPVALVWPGLDPFGDYVVLQYDYHSHGTYCATTAAGRDFMAQTGYGVKSMAGQAPATKIAASPALYYGTVAVSIYFFSGFDLATPYGLGSVYMWPTLLTNPWVAFEGWTWSWEYTGLHQADITSNSYGASGWALWGWNTGMDPSSVIFDYTILVSGTLHFVAVGNGGPGFGTVASPGSSTLAVGVGAVTEFTYRPAYAYHWPGSSRRVISWSNRGPTELGVVKPDITGVGAFAWAIGRTWDALNNLYVPRQLRGNGSFALFSGTSQATPMVAGASALVVSAYKSLYGSRMPAPLLKTLIMNYAYDMGFDELSQGAGFINAYAAIKALVNKYPLVYSTSILGDLLTETGANVESITYGRTVGEVGWYEPKIFIPAIRPGGLARRPLTVVGSGSYRAYAVRLEKVAEIPLCDIVTLNINPTVITGCVGENINFTVTAATIYGHLALNLSVLNEFDFFEIEVVFPFEHFETGGRTRAFNVAIPTTVLELAYWIDTGADGAFSWLETGRIFYDIRRANAVRIQMSRLQEQLEEIEHLSRVYMGVDPAPLPKYVVMRFGVSGATFRGVLPVKARLVGYKLVEWTGVSVIPSRFTIRSEGARTVNVVVRAPATPGFYSGYVVVEETTRGFKYLVPVSFFVPIELRSAAPFVLEPRVESTVRRNTYLRGAFDYTWRYESGDWRVFKVVVPPTMRRIWALGIRVTWPAFETPDYASNVDVHFYGPYTYYMVEDETQSVYTYKVSSVQLAAELSRDPAGGASYNPTRFWDSYLPGESIIVAPVSGPGVYRVVVRNIQFRGVAYEEPFNIELSPIMLTTSLVYRPRLRTAVFTITITAPDSRYLPLTVSTVPDGIYRPLDSEEMYYIASLEAIGITMIVGTPTTTPTTYKFTVTMTLGENVPLGYYILPLDAVMQMKVTTVGWLTAGTRTVYYEWTSIPVYLRFTLTQDRVTLG